MLSSCGKSSEADFQKFVQQQNCITTSEVVRNFETIKDRAQTLFSQSNRVCGIVKQIASLSDSPHPMIALEAPGWKGLINVGDVDKATVAGMSKGDFAVFECREISNAYWYPFLHSCRVANRQTTGAVANEVGTREIPATAQNNASVQATDLRAMSCDELWYARNRIYADKGQCFRTDRAINAFGPRCHPPYGDLSQSEQVRVSEIRSWEQQKGC